MSKSMDFSDRYFELIQSLGVTANIMISPSNSKIVIDEYHDSLAFHYPLILKWGYVEDVENSYEFFEHVASTFKSPIAWILEPFTREAKIYPNGFSIWWLFFPKRIYDIAEERGLLRHEARAWLCENEPEFGMKTNEEFYNFVRHLDACYRDWVKKGKLKPTKI